MSTVVNNGLVRVNPYAYFMCFDYLDDEMEEDGNSYFSDDSGDYLDDDDDLLLSDYDLISGIDPLLNLDFIHYD